MAAKTKTKTQDVDDEGQTHVLAAQIVTGDACAVLTVGDSSVTLTPAELDVFARQVAHVQHHLY